MIKKKIIKKLLLEGSTQVSAVLPRQEISDVENTFSLYFPVLLDSINTVRSSQIEKFQVVFYNNTTFNSDFDSKFNQDTDDFKTFSSNSSQLFTTFQDRINKNFYHDKHILSKSYEINFSSQDIETINNQYIYKLAFTNLQSKEIKDGEFNCCRIFCLKGKTVIDDTDIVFFPSSNFINNVYQNRIVYDLNYFLDKIYFVNFANNISLEVDASQQNKFVVILPEAIDSNIGNGNIDFVIEYSSKSTNYNLISNIDLSNVSRANQILDSAALYEKIAADVIKGRSVFYFNVICSINFSNDNISKNFTKTILFSKGSSTINNIFNAVKDKVSNLLFDNLNLKIVQSTSQNHIKIDILSQGESFDPDIISDFYFEEIKINKKTISQKTYLTDSLDVNSKLDLIGKNFLESFSIENKSSSVYTQNIPSETLSSSIVVKSISNSRFSRTIKSELMFNKFDYKSVYNDVNIVFNKNCEVTKNNERLSQISITNSLNSYEKITIVNLKDFKTLAYQLGYYQESEGQNSDVIANIKEFLSSCVFMFKTTEEFTAYKTSTFSTQNYFYGEEILNFENFDDTKSFIDFNSTFVQDLNTSFSKVTKNINDNNKEFKIIKSVFANDLSRNDVDLNLIKNFLSLDSLSSKKTLEVKVIPLPKLVKVFQGCGIDENSNIIFNQSVSDDTKVSVNMKFLNMFYDSNSSLNWDRFQKIKNTYFYNKDIISKSATKLFTNKRSLNEVSSAFANTFSYMWDYLSSSLYIDPKNIFTFIVSTSKAKFFQEIEERLENLSKNENTANFHFEKFSKNYFDLNNNTKRITLVESNISVKFLNFVNKNKNRYPRSIKFEKNSDNRNLRLLLDITQFISKFEIEDVINAEIYLKYSIHPLIKSNSSNKIFDSLVFYKSQLGSESVITQNHKYMSEKYRKYFSGYNSPINKSSINITQRNNKVFLEVIVAKDLSYIDSQTFIELFRFCMQKECNRLIDFYLRLGLSLKINNKYLYANILSAIPRNNINNEDIFIDYINSISEVGK